MPLRAASTRTLRARASAITAEAVALMTAVTPPLWAYSRVPLGIGGSLWGGAGPGYGIVARFVPRPGQSTPRGASSFSVFGAIDATGTSWFAGVRPGNAGRAPEGSYEGAACLQR